MSNIFRFADLDAIINLSLKQGDTNSNLRSEAQLVSVHSCAAIAGQDVTARGSRSPHQREFPGRMHNRIRSPVVNGGVQLSWFVAVGYEAPWIFCLPYPFL
jgi:hypothetical protein